MGRAGRLQAGMSGGQTLPLAATAIAMLLLGAAAAAAQAPSGAVLAGSCAACHGTDGGGSGSIPAIGTENLAARMRAMRSAGSEVTIMNRIARGYSDAEIDAIARYFEARPR